MFKRVLCESMHGIHVSVFCCVLCLFGTENREENRSVSHTFWNTRRFVCLVKLQVVTAAGEWGVFAQKKEKTERFEGGSASVCIILWGIYSLSLSLKYVTAQEINKEERSEVQGRRERRGEDGRSTWEAVLGSNWLKALTSIIWIYYYFYLSNSIILILHLFCQKTVKAAIFWNTLCNLKSLLHSNIF